MGYCYNPDIPSDGLVQDWHKCLPNERQVAPTLSASEQQTACLIGALNLTPNSGDAPSNAQPAWDTGNLVLFILLALYFLPSVIAFSRDHHDKFGIFALDLLLGWTVLGWIAALVWSLTAVNRPPDVVVR